MSHDSPAPDSPAHDSPGRQGGQRESPDGPGAGGPSPVPPGTGWPEDPASPLTPVARDAAQVRALAGSADSIEELAARQSVCRACPRLVSWREQVATVKRRAYAAQRYWGRPVPGWGAARPEVFIVGLAPAAHGGNRTGRIFTGDRSGDVLFASLHRCGLAGQPASVAAGDGQRLVGTRITATVHCAPPANKPSPVERDACWPWLAAELAWVAPSLRVIVCLGSFAWQAIWPTLAANGFQVPRPRPAFGHGVEVAVTRAERHALDPKDISEVNDASDSSATRAAPDPRYTPDPVLLIGCYHPSQQNTFTGRVTHQMIDAVFMRAREQARR